VRVGSYHTLQLEAHRQLTLLKGPGGWDAVALARVRDSCDPTSSADVAAVVLHEGLANICLITSSMTHVRQRIESNIPRKGKSALFGHDKAMRAFFEKVLAGLCAHVDFSVVKCVLVASPGFVNQEWLAFMHEEALRRDLRDIIENRDKFMLCHSSSGYKHALSEALSDPVRLSSCCCACACPTCCSERSR